MVKGIVKIIVLTFILIGLYLVIQYTELSIPFGERFYLTLTFFFVQSVFIHIMFTLGQKHLDISIPLLVMAAMTFRLLTALMFVGTFIVLGTNDVSNFVITFFVIYLFYFVFEISTVLSNLRTNSK